MPSNTEDDFWRHVEVGDCWNWTRALDRDGYGRFRLNGSYVRVHRLSYELLVGPIPENLVIDHLCRNRRCVNPDHLEIVTAVENLRRGHAWDHNRQKTHCPQGHMYTPGNTLIKLKTKSRQCRTCNREKKAERRFQSSLLSLA